MKIAILGAGKLGVRVAEALLDGDYDITLVDTNENRLNQLAQMYDILPVVGDAKNVQVIKDMNIKDYDFLFSCTHSDEVNIIAASFAKALGCNFVGARVRDPEHMNQLDFIREHFNIDLMLNPDLLITSEIYRYLTDKYTLRSGIYTLKSIALIEFEADKQPGLLDKDLVQFRSVMPNMIVVGISRNGKLIIPHGSDVIKSGDLVYVVGEKKIFLTSQKKSIPKGTKSVYKRL